MMVINGGTKPPMKWATTSFLLLLACIITGAEGTGGGKWELLLNNSGVVAMHMALTHRDTVIIFDQTTYGRSGYRLSPNEPCADDDPTCWAHSIEYHIASNTIRPLPLKTDVWCSSGAFLGNGTLAQTGGYGDGDRRIRYFRPCSDSRCGWIESESTLADNRWYATNHILPENDRMIVAGGRNAFTYEFVPTGDGAFQLPLLHDTYDRREGGNNLYPIVHLSSDGNLFIFANRDSILLDYHNHVVIKKFPRIPGDGSRSYPSTGSSVMLPLDHDDGFRKVEIMVCGGATTGAYQASKGGEFLRGLSSCGRMVITDEKPEWVMEEMPGPRIMNDMLILPTGDVLIINGATHGCAGWERATNPSYSPYLYNPSKRIGERFSVLDSSGIARMYHSSAIVLPDGRILVAGSNPYKLYNFSGVPFATELRLEAYVPYYMGQELDDRRASSVSIHLSRGSYGVGYGEEFEVRFELAKGTAAEEVVEFYVYAPPFATHSLSMSQRMLRLRCSSLKREERGGLVRAVVVAPPTPVAAPLGYYLLTVVNGGVPSKSEWVRFIHA